MSDTQSSTDITQEMQTLEEVAENLSELLTNSVNMVDKYYEIFFDQEPHYVELQQYGSDGQIYTTLVPNRAMDRSIALSGDIDPEGEVSGTLGTLYINTLTRDLFLKKTDSGKAGWENITPQRLEVYTETFTVTASTTSVEVINDPVSKRYIDIYEDGVHLEPDEFDLDESNSKVIKFNKVFTNTATIQVRYIDGLYGIKGEPGDVSDVKVNDTSVVSNSIANIYLKTINNNSIIGTGNVDIDALPSQTGHAGKYLRTDGTTASWENCTQIIIREW